MAHFAKIDENNIVERVIVVGNNDILDENGNESEAKGIAFCQSLFGGNWVQTSYNKKFRKNYAGRGYFYHKVLDAFIPQSPFPSWTLDEATCSWVSPVPYPAGVTDPYKYIWNEQIKNWEEDPNYVPLDSGV